MNTNEEDIPIFLLLAIRNGNLDTWNLQLQDQITIITEIWSIMYYKGAILSSNLDDLRPTTLMSLEECSTKANTVQT